VGSAVHLRQKPLRGKKRAEFTWEKRGKIGVDHIFNEKMWGLSRVSGIRSISQLANCGLDHLDFFASQV
jgi:hypothetical protein